MRIKLIASLVATFLFILSLWSANAGAEDRFATAVQPLLKSHCYICHADGSDEGDVALDRLSHDLTDPLNASVWQKVYEQMILGQMPPAKEKQPHLDDVQQALDWIADQLVEHGHGTGMEKRLLHPRYGNVINHEKLFDGSVEAKPFTPARLWRYRPAIYRHMLPVRFIRSQRVSYSFGGEYKGKTEIVEEDLILGGHNVKGLETEFRRGLRARVGPQYSNPFYELEHHASGFTDYDSIAADLASLEALMRNAEEVAQVLTVGENVRLIFTIKTEDSVHANAPGKFTGGINGEINKPFREHLPWFKDRWSEQPAYYPTDVFHPWVVQEEPLTEAQCDEIVTLAFKTLLHRDPDEQELSRYRGFLKQNMSEGKLLAIQGVITAICISPEFVYRMELGLGENLPDGRRRLSSEETFFAIHYALTDQDPQPYFKGNRPPPHLDTREGVYAYVMQRLERIQLRPSPKKTDNGAIIADYYGLEFNTQILKFFHEYFGYHKAPGVFKDQDRFPYYFNGQWLVSDTDRLLSWILAEDEQVFEKLLTDTRATISLRGLTNEGEPHRSTVVYSQGSYIQAYIDDFTMRQLWEYDQENPSQPVELPKDQRAGILTQPAWLFAHSTNFDNDPIRRGRWIREHLLGQMVPDVPQDVDAKVPEDPHKTLRERLAVTREARCWTCHQKMDELGYAFEMFADSGAYRTEELGKPVVTNGAITFSGDPELDGEVDNAVEMLHKLADSDLARQVFLRHVFRFFMGRNELISDSQTLIEMDKAYRDNNGSFKHVLATLLSSDSFLYRK